MFFWINIASKSELHFWLWSEFKKYEYFSPIYPQNKKWIDGSKFAHTLKNIFYPVFIRSEGAENLI